jgi:RNA polymerase primary sigma factor
MSTKELYAELEELFKENEKGNVTYEKVMALFVKQPTASNVKKMTTLIKKYKITLITSAELAKLRNLEEALKRAEEAQKLQDEALEKEFDLANEKELLEWSRSDSPVRMYLREMGLISLLTKEEEIEISKKIEFGEDIIIDAFCSVPYLIDFIIDYKEALINRERRVKELFRNFEDDEDSNDDGEDSEKSTKKATKKDNKRTEKVLTSFKALEKAKKDWLKAIAKTPEDMEDEEAQAIYDITVAFKKKILKEMLLDLGPTSKLINELVRSMETSLKSDDEFDKELKRLEYRLPLFNDTLKKNHDKLLEKIMDLGKDEITASVPEATMVSTYVEIKKLFQTKEASKESFNLDPEVLKEMVRKLQMSQKLVWQNQTYV